MKQTPISWNPYANRFLISQSITLFGSTLVQMAIVWYVTLQTRSGVWVAACSICSYVPQFLMSLLGGVWADRYPRKRLMILADTLIALITLAAFGLIPLCPSESILFGMFLLISVIRSIGAGVQTPAVNAVIPRLVPAEHLARYNGFFAAMQSLVQFAAPAAAGVVLSCFSIRTTLLVDVGTAIIGVGLLSNIPIPAQVSPSDSRDIWRDLQTGFRYAHTHNLLGRLLVIHGLLVFLCVPGGFMSGLLVSRVYGDTYGYLTGVELAGFAGMTAGGLLIGILSGCLSRRKTLVFGLSVFGSMSIGMGMTHCFPLYLLMMTLYGIALTVVQTTITTWVQEQAADSMQGRIFGFMSSIYAGCLPLGMALFGPLADAVPLQWLLVGAGATLLLLAGWSAQIPSSQA